MLNYRAGHQRLTAYRTDWRGYCRMTRHLWT